MKKSMLFLFMVPALAYATSYNDQTSTSTPAELIGASQPTPPAPIHQGDVAPKLEDTGYLHDTYTKREEEAYNRFALTVGFVGMTFIVWAAINSHAGVVLS